jgi:tetratricopeptide (TPR) repeat protein
MFAQTRPWIRFLAGIGWLALCSSSFLIAPAQLPAQVTPGALIGQDVAQLGPEAADVERAIARFGQGDVDGARRHFASAWEANSQLPPPDILVARLYRATNNLTEYRKSLDKASAEAPQDPEAFIALGELAFTQQRLAEAVPLFAKGLELCSAYKVNDQRLRVLRVRGLAGTAAVHEQRGQWDQAEQAIHDWIELDPNNTLAQTRLGRSQFEQKKYKEAYATFTKMYEADDSVPRPEVNMAVLYEQSSQKSGNEQLHEQAEKLMRLAVERVPDHLETRLAAAQWGLEAGQLDFAKANAQAALNVDPASLPARIAVGAVARHEKDFELAEELFEASHLESPINFAAINNLALTLIEQSDANRRRRALEFAQVNTRLYPDLRLATGREAAVTVAWVLHHFGRHAEAARQLTMAGRAGNLSSESTYYAARILATQGNREGARKLLEQVLLGRQVFPHRDDAERLLEELRD